MRTLDYLDAIKERYQVSDYKAAPLIGVGKAAVSIYRNKGGTFNDETALRVAELLDLDPLVVLADMHAERAKSEDVKRMWQRLHEMASHAAVFAFVVVILSAVFGAQGDAQAAGAALSAQGRATTGYYVK